MEGNFANSLSAREEEVIKLAAQGCCDKEIANTLGVQISTVRTYWERIRAKTASKSRTHAVCAVIAPEFARPSNVSAQA